MAGNFSTTARNALRYLLGTSKVSDVDEGFQRLAEDVDTKMLSFWEDTFAKRPAAGQPNRFFKASDTGLLYHDTGTVWEQLVTTTSVAGAYTGLVVRELGVEYELSATRAALVFVFAENASKGEAQVNGVKAGVFGSETAGTVGGATVLVPPGQKLKLVKLGEGSPAPRTTHILL